MIFIENLLILAGIGLDVFAAFEIQGAMLAQVKKRALFIACAVVAALELVFYFAGYITASLLAKYEYILEPNRYGEIIAVIILALLGIRLIIKAVKREFIHESRSEGMKVWDYIVIIVVSSLYTLAAGAASGLIGTSILMIVIMILIISIVMVIGGIYMGFHFGFENKTFAYVAGSVLLWIASAEILITKVLEITIL